MELYTYRRYVSMHCNDHAWSLDEMNNVYKSEVASSDAANSLHE